MRSGFILPSRAVETISSVAMYEGRTSSEDTGKKLESAAPAAANHGTPFDRREASVPRLSSKDVAAMTTDPASINHHTRAKLTNPSRTTVKTESPAHNRRAPIRGVLINSRRERRSRNKSPSRMPRSFHLPIKFADWSAKDWSGMDGIKMFADWNAAATTSAVVSVASSMRTVLKVLKSAKDKIKARNAKSVKSIVSTSTP